MAFIKISKCRTFSPECLLKLKGVFFKSLICSNLYTKVFYKMKSAYFQNVEGEEKVEISISFNEFNTDRLLKFNRKITESLDDFLKRLEFKIMQFYTKKVLRKAAKKNLNIEATPKIDLFFLVNNQRLSNDTLLKDIFSRKISGDLKLRIADSDYDVIVNSPMVKNLSLPKVLRVGGIAYPEKFETISTIEDKSEFLWLKSTKNSGKDWKKCGEGFFYSVKEEDSGHFLKLICTPRNFTEVGPTFEVVSEEQVQRFENTVEIDKRHNATKEATQNDEFRIVTYNILAECYTQTKEAKATLFTFCNSEFLDFDYRKCLINYELSGYKADIVCLQEVDRTFYKNELLLWFTGLNYCCLFNEKEGAREGCAFLYNPKKFNSLHVDKYVFTNELLTNPMFCDISEKISENESLKVRLQNIASLVQVVVLECLTVPNQVLIIGNTHFYFHPNACHIRLLQGIACCQILSNSAKEFLKKNPSKKVSVILCGDFNSTPETGFHKLLRTGSVDESNLDWKSSPDEEIKNLSYSHPIKFQSAYSTDEYTNYTPLFKGCLDYIYFQCDHLEVKQTVPVPSEEILSEHEGIPNKNFPSDHVALIADLKFKI